MLVFFHRKPIPGFHFSVEIIFSEVRKYLPIDLKYSVWEAPVYSKGIFNRLLICVAAAFNRSNINHVTGDISFIGLVLKKSKTIQTILDCIFMQQKSGLKKSILKTFWLTIPVRRAKFVTTISNQIKEEIIGYTGCDPNKVKVIYISLPQVFSPRKNEPFNPKPVVLLIGTAPNKNWRNVLTAIGGMDIKIIFIGKEDSNVTSLLEELKFDYVCKTGLNQAEMMLEYEKSDLLIFASTYEGFGMPIIEAQAIGVPVVTSNLSSMPEVAGNGAHLVNPYDLTDIRNGVEKVLLDTEYRNKIIKYGFENIKRFDPRHIANQYIELYKMLKLNK